MPFGKIWNTHVRCHAVSTRTGVTAWRRCGRVSSLPVVPAVLSLAALSSIPLKEQRKSGHEDRPGKEQ